MQYTHGIRWYGHKWYVLPFDFLRNKVTIESLLLTIGAPCRFFFINLLLEFPLPPFYIHRLTMHVYSN